MLFVVAYDIGSDKRRNLLASLLENYGHRAQFSIFECDLDAPRLETLLAELRHFNADDEQIRVYAVCQGCVRQSLVINGPDFAVNQGFFLI